ncbi:MAG: AMP-binding protein, partial [Ectothiorhodospiraceae bacterium]
MRDDAAKPATSAYGYPLILRDLLRDAVSRNPEQVIVSAGREYSYRDLNERVHRLAASLAALGVAPGDTVAVMDWDTHRYLECFYAIPMMGAVLHMVNVRLSREQILYTIKHARDDVILVNADFLPVLEEMAADLQGVRAVVVMDDGGVAQSDTLPVAGEYEQRLREAEPEFDFPDLDENTRATTFYTTGTTGNPKGVFFSHRQLMLHTLAVRAALAGPGQGRFNEDDVYMPITPMFHVHAWGVPYVATLLGVRQVYPGRYDPGALLGLIREQGVSFSHCVPTILQMLLEHPDARDGRLDGWKVVIGGSALPRPLCRRALDFGIDVYTGYGMSETCPILTLALLESGMTDWDMDRQAAQRCKTGRPIPLVQLRIVDPAMADQPRDGSSQGEVVVRAPW